MSRANKQAQQVVAKPKFDTRPYQRVGLNESDILEIKEAFDIFDREHVGSINPKCTSFPYSELKNALSALGHEARSHPVYQVILDLDAEGAGNITFEQFIHLNTPRLIDEDTRENIDRIFTLFDTEKTGFITVRDLRRIALEIGEELNDGDLEALIARADANKDGAVSQDEFFELLSSK
jgi:Ca2+-binding EF-hand superfamily protein